MAIVRTCALEHISTVSDARSVLREEIHRYNYLQIHSTTHEIPALRFEKARKENRSLFRPFTLPSPSTSVKDVFAFDIRGLLMGIAKSQLVGTHSKSLGLSQEKMSLYILSRMRIKTRSKSAFGLLVF